MTKRASDAAWKGRACGSAQCLAFVIGVALAAPLAAQDAPGSRQMTVGIESRVIARSNPSLVPGGTARTLESLTRVSFGLRSETPASFIALDITGSLRLGHQIGGGQSIGLTDPGIVLSFRSEAASSFIAGSAYLRETDLSQDPSLDPFVPPVGTQRRAGGDLTYRWGEDRRAGFGLTASLVDTSYRDAPGQIDNFRYSLGGDIRLDLTEVSQLTLGLAQSRFAPQAGAARDTTALTAALAIERPLGPISFSASLTQTPEGQRTAVSVGRRLELPDGQLSAQVGLTHGVTGKFGVTGELGYSRDLPNGRIFAAFSRSVTANENDLEVTQTRVSLGYGRELTDRTRVLVELGLGESSLSSTGTAVRSGTLAATLSHELDMNWALDLGYQLRAREVTGQPAATSSTIFIGLRRQFVSSF